MKTNVTIAHGILNTGQESLFHWKQSLGFVIENSVRSASELKDVHDLVHKIIDKFFQYLKILHIESFISTNGKLVDIERMKSEFLAFVDEVVDPLNFQVAKFQEMSAANAVIRRKMEKFKSRVARIDELIEMHDYWMTKADNILIPGVEELEKVTKAMKAYRAKSVTSTKA